MVSRSVVSTADAVSTVLSFSESPDPATSPRKKHSRPLTNCAHGCAASSAGRWRNSATSGYAGATLPGPKKRTSPLMSTPGHHFLGWLCCDWSRVMSTRHRRSSPTRLRIRSTFPRKERPPFGDLRLAPLLDAQAEIAAAASDVDTARQAADALQSIADSYSSRSRPCAALATARAALISGDLGQAIDECGAAIAAWAAIGAPFETARACMVLGDAHHRSGNVDRARMEWRAAREHLKPSVRCAGPSEQNISSPALLPSQLRPRAGWRRRHSDATATRGPSASTNSPY